MSSAEFFSDDDARQLDAMVGDGFVDGQALDPAELQRNPAPTRPVSEELIRFSRSVGSEGLLLVRGLPRLSLDTQELLGRSILELNELPFDDENEAEQVKIATRTIDAWSSFVHAEVRTPLALGAKGLQALHRISERRAQVLGDAITRFCGLPLPEYPNPEYAAYFCDTLDDVPAHIVRESGTAKKEVRPIRYATMAQCLRGSVSLPVWVTATAEGSAPALAYMQDYERRFMMTRGIFEAFISPDDDLGID